MIGEGVFAFLATQSAVNQLTGTRIVPDMSPKNMDYPRLVYTRISTTRPKVLQGLVGVATARYQIDAWGLTPRSASALADAVRQAVQTWQNNPAPPPWGSMYIENVTIEDEGDDYQAGQDSSDQGAYRSRLDLEIWYQEAPLGPTGPGGSGSGSSGYAPPPRQQMVRSFNEDLLIAASWPWPQIAGGRLHSTAASSGDAGSGAALWETPAPETPAPETPAPKEKENAWPFAFTSSAYRTPGPASAIAPVPTPRRY